MVQTVNGAATLESFDFVQKPALASFTPDSAGTDQTVVIRGNNLATTSQVLFGNIPAHAFTIISDTEIHAKPGEGSTGHLKIITLAGEYSLPGFRFKPAPKIFSVTPDSGIAGAPVSIRGEHFIGTTSVYIGSGKVSSFTVISDSIIIAIIEEGHNGYVHVTNQFGTSGVAPFFTYTFVPVIRSFSPKVGGEGTRMKIEVENAYVVDSIKIGGVPVRERLPLAFQQIEVVVGKGATGKISLQTGGKIVLSSDSFEYVEKPVLKSFTPSTGKIGTIVTVTGAQFHNTAKVYFGGAMASQVNVLSDTVLTAIVSNGASGDLRLETAGGKISLPGFVFIQSLKPKLNSFAPLSGKAGTLVTISGENFNPDPASNFVRFGASYGKVIIASTTELKVEAPAGASAGILEVTTNGYSMLANNFFTLESAQKRELKDTTFTWRKTLMPAKNAPGLPIGSGDLDGDGKADLVLFSGTDECKVYLNTSNNDAISFSEAIKITAFSSLRSILLHDMDQDGRVDLIGGSGSAIKILKNTSRPGKISFDNPVERTGGRYSYFRATDVNGDGKPEIIGLGESGDVYIFRNTSSGSTMSFGSFYRFPYGPNNYQFEMADLSGDGKPDLITADNNVTYPERSMVIFQNTSTEDTISFSQSMTFNGGGAPNRFIPGDYNHDNRIDLIIHHYDGVQYVENTSANGIISFAPITRIFTNTSTNYSDIGDLNGDGLVDLVVQKSLDSALYIYSQNFSNNIVSFVPVAQSPARATVKHFVMRDLNNNGSPEMLVIGGDEQLHLFSADVVIPIADTCRLIANIGMSRDSSCAGNQTVYSAFASGTFTNPTYAWYINGILHPFMGATFKDPALRAGDKVNVVIRANTPCGVRADTSIIFTNTYVILKPTARITGITKVKGGQTTVLKVEIRNSFHTTGYQWQDSTSTHSWKTIANANLQLLMYKPAVSGDKLRSIVVSSDSCGTSDTLVTDAVIFEIIDSPVPLANLPIRAFPNPVGSVLSLNNINPADQWQSIELIGSDGHRFLIIKNIQNSTSINLNVAHIPPGLYYVIFKRSTGENAYLRIIKQ
ncbi:MAG: T9SS type A sorting domain-containing protein [Chitinophagaceae bacterium]|nr:MAG: T9SS type A sorting domain-containing protein [Chitinophagaceae bacterium]